MTLNGLEEHHQILNSLYVQACSDLLAAYGLTVHIREHRDDRGGPHMAVYMSILGAAGEGLRLSSTLKIDRDLVLNTHPLHSPEVLQDDLEDWCRELNNQLVGRVKNKLLGYGVEVTAGLPLLISGTDVVRLPEADSEVHAYCVESAHGQIALTLTTLIAPEVEFHESEPPMDGEMNGEAVMAEGMIALF